MKFAALFTILSLTSSFNMAYASNDSGNNDEEILSTCNEQLEMEGIENEAEKAEYLRACIDGFSSSDGEQTSAE